MCTVAQYAKASFSINNHLTIIIYLQAVDVNFSFDFALECISKSVVNIS
jgi:hypothetical protein